MKKKKLKRKIFGKIPNRQTFQTKMKEKISNKI